MANISDKYDNISVYLRHIPLSLFFDPLCGISACTLYIAKEYTTNTTLDMYVAEKCDIT